MSARSAHRAGPRPSPCKPLAVAAVAAAALAVGGQGVWAGLAASATNTSPQAVGTGGLALAMSATGAGLTQAIAALAPGDTVNRHLVLTNGGSVAAGDITFAVAGTATSPLVTDSGTLKGLRVKVSTCSVAYVATTGVCGGTEQVALGSRTIAGLDTAVTLASVTTAAGPVYLQVSLTLPDQDEVTTNGTVPASTVQNKNVALTYTFTTVQRAGRTTNS